MGRNRRHASAATLLVAFLTSTCWLPGPADAGSVLDPQNGRLVTVEIAGNTLNIPRNYFQGTVPTSTPDGIFITALMPSMDPMREDNKNEFLYARGFGRTVNVLMEDQHRSATIEFRLNASQKRAAPFARMPDQNGLEVYLPTPSATANKGTLRQEIYAVEEGEQLTGYITCILDGDVPFPSCAEEFVYRNLLLRVTYDKAFLPTWKTIQESVKNLIDRFSS